MDFQKLFRERIATGKPLNEMYMTIPGSFDAYRTMISKSLRDNPPTDFGATDDGWGLHVEGIISESPYQIIVENYEEGKYYRADVDFDDEGVTFDNIEEVEMQVYTKAKNEMLKMESQISAVPEKEFHEIYEAKINIEDRNGHVDIAQKADVVNGNLRLYPKEVMRDAVNVAKEEIATKGPLLMDSLHRTGSDGEPETDLTKMVAVIHSIDFNEKMGTVSLPNITFVENQAGTDLMKLLEAGAKLQVSQRAYGTSVEEEQDGEMVEVLKFLRIRGFDFVPSGEASVEKADFTLDEGVPQKETVEKEPATLEQGEQPSNDGGEIDMEPKELKELIAKSVAEAMNESKQDDGASVLKEEVTQLNTKLVEQGTAFAALQRDKDMDTLKVNAKPIIEAKLNEYEHFNETHRDVIRDCIDLESIFPDIVNVNDVDELKKLLDPKVEAEAARTDKIIAANTLNRMGYPTGDMTNTSEGVTYATIQEEHIPGAETRKKLEADVISRFNELDGNRPDVWVMPKDHQGEEVLSELMEDFNRTNYHGLVEESKRLNEANEVGQANIGPYNVTIASMIVPVAWRRITAFDVVQMGRLRARVDQIPITKWTPDNVNPSGRFSSRWSDINIVEDAVIPLAGVDYDNFTVIATRKALRSQIRSEAVATARGSSMRPIIDTVAGLAMDVRDRTDQALWWLHVIRGMMHDVSEVSTFEDLTEDGITNVYESDNEGWLPMEWYKNFDTNSNPTTSGFRDLYPADGDGDVSGTTLQAVEVVYSSSNTDMLFNTDYTVNWANGSISLTAAGVTKAGAEPVKAKYTHSNNFNTWSAVAPSSVTAYQHLRSLRRAIGLAKVRVTDRNYNPSFFAASADIHDLINNSPYMTNLDGTDADMLDRMANVTRFSGLSPIMTTALEDQFLVVGERNAACHHIHTPWMLEGPITEETKGHKFYIAEEYSADEIPVTDKLGIVGVTDRFKATAI